MFRSAIHLLLVAVLLVCPVWCRLGICTSADPCCALAPGLAADQPDCDADCCQRCDASCSDVTARTDSRACPSPDRHPSDRDPCDERCQCICGGAVAPRDGDIDLDDHCRQTLELAAVVTQSIAQSPFRQATSASARQQGNTPQGQRICCLHMRWQC